MADIRLRNVPKETIALLETRAARSGRSLNAEALEALQIGARPTGAELVAWLKTVRPPISDVDAEAAAAAVTKAIREDRDR